MSRHARPLGVVSLTTIDAADAALVVGASLRLTRLVTTDDLGGWYVRDPAQRWARLAGSGRDRPSREPDGWRERLVGGLTCPFCVGYHIGVGTLASYVVARALGPRSLTAWRFVAATLALNEVVGHVSARLDG